MIPKATLPAAEDYVDQAFDALRQGQFAQTRDYIRLYAAEHPREAQHYLIEGLATLAMADWLAARDLFALATDTFPEHPQMWFNRALAEENLGQLADAETHYQRSMSLKPDQPEILGNLSNIYRKLGRFPEAVQMACRAVASNLPKASALNLLGLALGKQGNFVEGQKAFDEALLLAPKDGMFLANRANIAVDQLRFDEAWKYFSAAHEQDDSPILRRDEGMARLLAGDYVRGLPLYEARLELPNALRVKPTCPRWNGEGLNGKTLLLVSEQGFGDIIQFSRYADKLTALGANLVWVVRQPLLRLLTSNLIGIIITEEEFILHQNGTAPLPSLRERLGAGQDVGQLNKTKPSLNPSRKDGREAQAAPPHLILQQCDFWLPILSLPFALGMAAPTPSTMPNFKAPAEPKLLNPGDKKKIGLVWFGSRTHERDHERSLALSQLRSVWEKTDAQFFAPFKGAADELMTIETPIIALDHLITDFADMAALLSQLDCLITVDTAAAHLAGAMGVKTYLLLPHCPDWRWGAAGETTAWYPNTTILRQPAYGDWDRVVKRLLEKLA